MIKYLVPNHKHLRPKSTTFLVHYQCRCRCHYYFLHEKAHNVRNIPKFLVVGAFAFPDAFRATSTPTTAPPQTRTCISTFERVRLHHVSIKHPLPIRFAFTPPNVLVRTSLGFRSLALVLGRHQSHDRDFRWAVRPVGATCLGVCANPAVDCQKRANDASQSAGAAKGLKLSRKRWMGLYKRRVVVTPSLYSEIAVHRLTSGLSSLPRKTPQRHPK